MLKVCVHVIDTQCHINLHISYVLRARDILDFMNPRASAFVLSRA